MKLFSVLVVDPIHTYTFVAAIIEHFLRGDSRIFNDFSGGFAVAALTQAAQ